MKTINTILRMSALTCVTVLAISCNDGKKKGATNPMSNEMHQGEEPGATALNSTPDNAQEYINDYLNIKKALVNDNTDSAAEAGGKLASTLKSFDMASYTDSDKNELKDIIDDAMENAEHISDSPMEHQREHFDLLSKDMIDMVAITGTSQKLYQDICPMYNDNKGAQWLSMTEDIKNPYYGSKMMTCGKMQKEITP